MKFRLAQRQLLKFMSLWPPFLGAGIRVKTLAPDLREVVVEMRLRPWTKNYVGTHYGGSLYSMTDPFYMAMLIENLGRDYIVWDKAATIRFKKPGKGKVTAHFKIGEDDLDRIRAEVREKGRAQPTFQVLVKNEQDEVVAEVDKLLSVKPKPQA